MGEPNMKLIKCLWLPFRDSINLFGIIFYKGKLDKYKVNAHRISCVQMQELFYIFYYLYYNIESIIIWFLNLFKNNISYKTRFEEEIDQHSNDLTYLKWRAPYSCFKYLQNN